MVRYRTELEALGTFRPYAVRVLSMPQLAIRLRIPLDSLPKRVKVGLREPGIKEYKYVYEILLSCSYVLLIDCRILSKNASDAQSQQQGIEPCHLEDKT